MEQSPSKTTPASGSFTSSATTGSTRMRISMKAEGIPSSCELFTGEEDYSVNIVEASENTNPPTAPTNLAASKTTTSSTNLSWTAST
jgi:phosphoserine aminotransferase